MGKVGRYRVGSQSPVVLLLYDYVHDFGGKLFLEHRNMGALPTRVLGVGGGWAVVGGWWRVEERGPTHLLDRVCQLLQTPLNLLPPLLGLRVTLFVGHICVTRTLFSTFHAPTKLTKQKSFGVEKPGFSHMHEGGHEGAVLAICHPRDKTISHC